MTTRDIHNGAVSHTFPASPDYFRADCKGLFANPLSAQLARLLFLQGASLIHMMRWQSGYCSGLQPRVPPVRVRNASPFSQRSWIPFEPTAKGYTQHPLANHLLVKLYSPDQRARRRVPASGSPGSASHHHLLCFSAGRRCAADPGLTQDNL